MKKIRTRTITVFSPPSTKLVSLSYPKISGVVHMHRHVGSINAFHTVYGDALGFVLVLVSRFPEGLCGAIR